MNNVIQGIVRIVKVSIIIINRNGSGDFVGYRFLSQLIRLARKLAQSVITRIISYNY